MIANKDQMNYFDISQLPNPCMFETITQSIYDIQDYPAEGGSVYFFSKPVGTSDPPRTFADTNMLTSSCIPIGQAFIIESIRVRLMLEAESRADERRFYSRGYFSFMIGQKQYLGATPGELDPRTDPEIRLDFNTSGTECTVNFGSGELDHAGLKLGPNNLLLIPKQNFSLYCTDLPRLKNEARLAAHLFGRLMRQIA